MRRTQSPGYVSEAAARESRDDTAPRRSPIEARAEARANSASASFGSTRILSSAIRRISRARSRETADSSRGAASAGSGDGARGGPIGLMKIPRPATMRNSWNFSSGTVSFIEGTPILRVIVSPSRRRSMSMTPSNGWVTPETVAGLCISFSRRNRAVTFVRASFALLAWANA